LGAAAGSAVTDASNVICIGFAVAGANVSNSCYIGNIFGQSVGAEGVQVLVDSSGKLGTAVSSRRFKKEIKSMDSASESILALRPVTFQYRSDKTNKTQFGLIAEEVAEVNPDLVVRDKNGEIYTVRYDAVNAMLLNEFLKEQKKVEEQGRKLQQQEITIAQQRKDFEATITELKKEMATIVARFKDQDAKIQRVSDRVEIAKPGTQLVRIP
jgi:Chaperone of endosialidase